MRRSLGHHRAPLALVPFVVAGVAACGLATVGTGAPEANAVDEAGASALDAATKTSDGSVASDGGASSRDADASHDGAATTKASCVGSVDGATTLFIDGDPKKPFPAYCAGGKTYLPLAQPAGAVGANADGVPDAQAPNFASYSAHSYPGSWAASTTVVTRFVRVRFDPAKREIDPADYTFATSTGRMAHTDDADDGGYVTHVPFGVARDCGGNGSATGAANASLVGLPFTWAANNWQVGGYKAAGTTGVSADGRTATLVGGGDCGWNAPGAKQLGGAPLTLVYTP